MDHFRNLRNVGVIEDADGIGEVGNAKCGDVMKIYLKIENDIIVDVKFETFGCGSAIASSSMAISLLRANPFPRRLLLQIKQLLKLLMDCRLTNCIAPSLRKKQLKKRCRIISKKTALIMLKKVFPDCESCGHCSET